jgi:replicative DNA helicase
LQLTKGSNGKKREQEVAEISRLLKIMAQTHNLPIIALSQLNREVEKRENRKPILSDLRESGAIEQDADIVIFLYKERDSDIDSDFINLDIAKGRNIGLGSVQLKFNGNQMKFEEVIA